MEEWIKPRTIFATMFYVAFLYMVIIEKVEADLLSTMVGTIFGFYFGQRAKQFGGQDEKVNS